MPTGWILFLAIAAPILLFLAIIPVAIFLVMGNSCRKLGSLRDDE